VSSTSAALAPARAESSTVGIILRPTLALARRAFRDARVRTISYAYLFAIYAYIQAVGYRHAYPTLADRLGFARSFGGNTAIRLFYGEPHDLLSVSGYCAWRVGGTLAILAAIFGLLAAVRALRAEEDAGRMELVLATAVGRRTAYLASILAVAAGTLLLWLAELVGFLAGGLALGGSAYLALATVSVVPVCLGVGAITSQLAPTRRIALELGGAVVGVFFVLRVVADTSSGAGWLRWATPFGWAEELRPFSSPQPLVLLLPVAASALLLAIAARISVRRDVGTGLVSARDTTEPHLRLLRTPLAQTLRSERGSLLVWLLSVGAFAFILGTISTSVSSAGISKSTEREIAKLGVGSFLTPTSYISFVFIFFILAVSLFVCAQVSAARHEESEERLETLLAQPIGRVSWLSGRLALAACAATAISLVAGLLTWVGAASQSAHISLGHVLEAAANCLPIALLSLGIAALAFAIVPRAAAGIAYGLVAVAFLWDLVGSLLGAPRWLVELTPFEHVGLVPAQSFRLGDAAVMIAIGLLAALGALAIFRRRDLIGQ
jgi:ABC-2 type transport system permease protein